MVVDATLVACLGQLQGLRCCCSPGRAGPSLRDAGYRWPPGRRRPRGKRSGWSPRRQPPPNPLRASARLRLARLRPPSKIGSVSVGRKLQEREPPSNRPDISALEVPKLPVRLMRGKNAARAAPISALRARKRCSAARDVRASLDQLGRRAGSDVLQQLRPLPRTPRNRLRGIVAAQQQHQRVECLLFLPQVALPARRAPAPPGQGLPGSPARWRRRPRGAGRSGRRNTRG